MLLPPYNSGLVRSRSPQGASASEYRATREPPKQTAAPDPRDMPYPVTLVRDDSGNGEWVATIDALSGCNARGETPDEALERVASAVAVWMTTAEREGTAVPEPKSLQSHSGRLLLRMPQTLHAELARAAERERVSLNQFITDALSGALGWRSPERSKAGGTRVVPAEAIDGLADEEAAASRGPKSPRLANAVFVANGVIVALAAIVAIVVLIFALR